MGWEEGNIHFYIMHLFIAIIFFGKNFYLYKKSINKIMKSLQFGYVCMVLKSG